MLYVAAIDEPVRTSHAHFASSVSALLTCSLLTFARAFLRQMARRRSARELGINLELSWRELRSRAGLSYHLAAVLPILGRNAPPPRRRAVPRRNLRSLEDPHPLRSRHEKQSSDIAPRSNSGGSAPWALFEMKLSDGWKRKCSPSNSARSTEPSP
jgi:hypothetical protein